MKHFFALATALASTMFVAMPAVAQDAAPGNEAENETEVGLKEIIVTAQRTQTNLQETPVAVTAIGSDSLAERGVTNLLDIAKYAPSVEINTRSLQGGRAGGVTIRGIGTDAVGSSAAAGIYVDEVYYASESGNLLGAFDLERVEVLRGPQGTAFGRNTIAGAIQYVSTKPSSDLGGYITGTLGENDRREIAGAINIPLTDTLAIRAAARYNKNGGYVLDLLNNVKRGGNTVKQGRLQLRWEPSADVTVNLKGEISKFETNGRGVEILGVDPTAQFAFLSSTPAFAGPCPAFSLECLVGAQTAGFFAAVRPNPETTPLTPAQISTQRYTFAGFNAPDFVDFDFRTIQGVVSAKLSENVSVKSITAYSFSKDVTYTDIDATPLGIIAGNRNGDTDKTFSQELRLSGSFADDRLKVAIGAYYYRNTFDQVDLNTRFGRNGFASPQNNGDIRVKTDSKALYGQISFNVTDQLQFEGGLRYSSEKITGLYLNSKAPGVLFPPPLFSPDPILVPGNPPLPAPSRNKFNDWSPRFGVNFKASDDIFFYASASKGFRAGGVTVSGQLPGGGLSYGPETAWTYELGGRFEFADRRIRINPTIFQTDWKNIQFNTLFIGATGVQPINANAGDARIRGLELELEVAVTDGLDLTGAASFLDGDYKRIAPGIDVLLTDELQHAPKSKYSIGARYSRDLTESVKLTASMDYSWVNNQRSAVTNDQALTIPSYGLLNGRLGVELDAGFSISVYGTNLTNKYYYQGLINALTSVGTQQGDPGRPREFGVTAGFRF